MWTARGIIRYFLRLNVVDFTYDEAVAICRLLVDALSRWLVIDELTAEEPITTPSKLQMAVVRAAICQACPDKPIFCNKPKVTKCAGKTTRITLSVDIIDRTTRKGSILTKVLVTSTSDP